MLEENAEDKMVEKVTSEEVLECAREKRPVLSNNLLRKAIELDIS